MNLQRTGMPDGPYPSAGCSAPPCPPHDKKETDPTPVVGAGRLFTSEASLHVLNALDQCPVLRTIFVPHRLDRGLELFLVGNVVHDRPGFGHLLERFLFAVVPQLAFLLLRLPGDLEDQCLIFLRQFIPYFLREDEDLRDHQVAGLRVVLCITIMLPALVARIVVLRATRAGSIIVMQSTTRRPAT